MRQTLFIILLSLPCLAGLAQNGATATKPAAASPYIFADISPEPSATIASNAAPDAIPATNPPQNEPILNNPPAAVTVFSEPATKPTVTSTAPPAPIPATNAPVTDTPRALDDKHKLQPGDQFSFRIMEDRDPPAAPDKILTVGDSGEVAVPYIGLVNVSGKTCKQAQEEITALLEKDYYYKASVTMGLTLANKTIGRVYIWGQVKLQGALEIPSNETLTAGKAILRAGGFGDFAKKTKVKVIRNSNGQKKTFELNMEDILEKGQTEKDIPLEPDDFILVPERHLNM